MNYQELVSYSQRLKSISSRNEKVAIIVEFMKHLSLDEGEIGINYIAGHMRQRKISVGWKGLRSIIGIEKRNEPPPGLIEVDNILEKARVVRGKEKLKILAGLFTRLNEKERWHLSSLILGGVDQGAGEGLVKIACARFFNVTEEDIESAFFKGPDLAVIFARMQKKGKDALADIHIRLFTPVKPMLAETIDSLDELFEEYDSFAAEYKFDGIRIQVHRQGDMVKIFSRHLKDITPQLPEVVEAVKLFPLSEFIIDGEAIGVDEKGMPLPFQMLARRTTRKKEMELMKSAVPVQPRFFDIMYMEGEDITLKKYQERYKMLNDIVKKRTFLAPRLLPLSKAETEKFLFDSMSIGNDGLMIKLQDSPYLAGKRGRHWVKLKPVHTIDCVVLAAEWGHGRRMGWLSNLHLGVLDETRTKFLMVGKTFKGLTDKMLGWLTENLPQYKVAQDNWTMYLKPEVVLEIAFNEVQKSPNYDSGYALRFARVKKIRSDKKSLDINTIIDLQKFARINKYEWSSKKIE